MPRQVNTTLRNEHLSLPNHIKALRVHRQIKSILDNSVDMNKLLALSRLNSPKFSKQIVPILMICMLLRLHSLTDIWQHVQSAV